MSVLALLAAVAIVPAGQTFTCTPKGPGKETAKPTSFLMP